MSELISKIWNFFESDKVSVSRKITIPILFFLAVWVIDDMGGFSYQFTNSQKLDYLVKIEKTKEQFQKDTVVCNVLDKMKFDLIHRKTVFEQFIDLFDNQDIFKSELSPTINKDHIPILKVQRNQFLHTVSSSLFWIIWLFILLIMLLVLPFTLKKDKLGAIFGMIIGIGIMALLIWITQWLFGLIPIILNRPWINYTIQFIINLIPISLLTYGSIKQKSVI